MGNLSAKHYMFVHKFCLFMPVTALFKPVHQDVIVPFPFSSFDIKVYQQTELLEVPMYQQGDANQMICNIEIIISMAESEAAKSILQAMKS